ncbi:UDP-GalNAc:beta-1:3-N-acetylgalactosaminyltransferase 2-like protein [Dinothrombium tinctorium]|uniref:Hexosyltransferase n=1 Tax=Dinothrombium tinctorium TaxID=1965070 RepID=A0A443QWF9_9ACAR|nr:UDP-GalNAc:beta-1:3-N-acetylgalactosaminyltransferase 2-like protein [Dinothrombium tinctorium]
MLSTHFTKSIDGFSTLSEGENSLRDYIDSYAAEADKYSAILHANKSRLKNEIKAHNDILIVNTQDIYRHLPEKLLLFMNLMVENHNFNYMLKTDDDCFLNIPLISHELLNLSFEEKTWWANFRKFWAVDLYGKWSESEYEAPAYPPFACGSGYLITSFLVNWIVINKNFLHRFQGEDVSMGIWLSSLSPKYFQVCEYLIKLLDQICF